MFGENCADRGSICASGASPSSLPAVGRQGVDRAQIIARAPDDFFRIRVAPARKSWAITRMACCNLMAADIYIAKIADADRSTSVSAGGSVEMAN